MEALPTQSSHLLHAVESLKAAGLSRIGGVVQTTNPEFLDAAGFAEDIESGSSSDYSDSNYFIKTATGSVSGNIERKDSSDQANSITITVHPESISGLSAMEGSTDDTEIVSLRDSDRKEVISTLDSFDLETVPSVVTTETIKSLIKPGPAEDSRFSIEDSTNLCARGKDLWAEGRCEAAIAEFRKALLGLETILGTDHLLVSKLYQWIGQIFLRLLDDDDDDGNGDGDGDRRNGERKDRTLRRRAWADAAVEALTWCLRIRYSSRVDSATDTNGAIEHFGDDLSVDAETEGILARAWKIQGEEWSSPHGPETKSLELIWDSIRIERKADLALFRMERIDLSQTIDVCASLVNQYTKAMSVCPDDGGFSAMTKMAFWNHRLGRIKSTKNDSDDGHSVPSLLSMPLNSALPPTQNNGKNKRTRSRIYLENAAFWYRMALETFCTRIGRFDKTNDQHLKDNEIDVTTHPTYQQLILRIEQVLSDHNKRDENKDDDDQISYLPWILDSVFHHFRAKQAIRQYIRLDTNRSESLSSLKDLRRILAEAQEGFRTAANIEESAWGADHQIVLRMRRDLERANGFCNSLDEEILEFPVKQAERQKQQEQEELEKQKEAEQEKLLRLEKQPQHEKEQQAEEKQHTYDKQQKQKQKQKRQRNQRRRAPPGATARLKRPSTNGIETLRRLQEQVHESEKLLKEQKIERNRVRAVLRSKNGEIRKFRAVAERKEEEAMEWKRHCENARSEREALQNQIKQLQKQSIPMELKLEEGTDLVQSIAQNEKELMYWKEKFKAAQIEWTERQINFEEELEKARAAAGSNQAELRIKQLQEENKRLQQEVTLDSTERKQLEGQQLSDAMKKLAQSDSEVLAWKRKFEVAQKEWLAIHGKADEETRMAIADATRTTAELARWKKKFAIAQREWMECQTKAEKQARAAIATAKKYEESHSEIAEKFSAAQDGLRSLISQNKQLQKQVDNSQTKQDQLEFSLKKQAIDFASYQDKLNQKTAEAQIWKDQCQASQQAQKQFSQEMQLSRATDSNLQERIVVLLERNKELQADQERKKLELEAKNKEVASVKEAALKRIRQLKKEQQQLQQQQQQQQQQRSRSKDKNKGSETINSKSTKRENKDVAKGGEVIRYESNVDLSNPSSLAAKLGRTQRALEFVEKDYKDSLKEIEALTKTRQEMEESIAEAQHIISLLKTANDERIEQCSRLETEKDEVQRKLQKSLDESRQNKTQIEDDGKNSFQLDNEPHEAQQKIRSLLGRCEELEKKLTISDQTIEDLRKQVRDSKRDIAGGKQEDQEQNCGSTSPSQSIGEQQEDHQLILIQDLERKLKESAEVREDLSLKLKMCNEKIASADEKEMEYQRELTVTNQKIESLQDQVRDHRRETLATNEEQGDHYLTLLRDCERELEESIQVRENLSSELKSCEEKIQRLEENEMESKRVSDKYSQLVAELEESSKIKEEISLELSSLKKQLKEKEDEIDSLKKDEEFGLLEEKLSKLEQELEKSSNEKGRLQEQIENLTSTAVHDDEQRQNFVDKISTLEKALADSNDEIRSLKIELNELEKLPEEVAAVKKEKEELIEKCQKLEKQYTDTENQAEQNSKSLTMMLKVESTEQDRIREECSKLERDLLDMTKENLKLESRIEEMKKLTIDNLSDDGMESCKQCIVLGDELRSTIEQNEKHIEATEKFQDDHETLINRNNFLEKELQETMELNENLESRLLAKENSTPVSNLEDDDKYQDLNIRCIVLEEELRDANDLNDKRALQLEAMKKKIEDLEDYADSTASDLERALAMKATGSEGGVEVRLLIERCNKLQHHLREAQKTNALIPNNQESPKEDKDQGKEELSEPLVRRVDDNNNEAAQAGTADEQAVEELTNKLNEVTAAKEELETLLKEATEENEHQKRLKGHVEKDRDYLDKMYNECKRDMAEVQSDLETTKERLKKSNDEKEELERQLQIEKHVSQSLKSSKASMDNDDSEENELEELYRQARDELSEVENMLFETEEELDALRAKYQELEKNSKLSASERAESELSGEIVHDLQDLSRDELMVETRKALRKLQDTQTKVVDLQETNMILQAQLKSSLTFKEKNKVPARRKSGNRGFWSLGGGNGGRNPNAGDNNNNNNKVNNDDKNVSDKDEARVGGSEDGGNRGFWSLGGGNGGRNQNAGDDNKVSNDDKNVLDKDEARVGGSEDSPNNGNKRFWGWRGGAKGRNAENETNGDSNSGDQ